jgi:hypothetical protein
MLFLFFLVFGFMFFVVDCVLCSELLVLGLVFCYFVGACVRHYCSLSYCVLVFFVLI